MIRSAWIALATALLLAAPADAQARKPQPAPDASQVAETIHLWIRDFEAGRFQPHDIIHLADGRFEYTQTCRRHRLLKDVKNNKVSHFLLLKKLVDLAELRPDLACADALVALASTGFAKDMFDHRITLVREVGHFALMRIESPRIWQRIHDLATTKMLPAPPGSDGDSEEHADEGPTVLWRAAALKLLGSKKHQVFRSSIERCLQDEDGRIRLAATEALALLRKPQSLAPMATALARETHPMTATTLVDALRQMMERHPKHAGAAVLQNVGQAALSRLGKVDWRTDIAVIQLVHRFPIRAAVPRLIQVIRDTRAVRDPVLRIINRNASKYLGMLAHQALRSITGAVVDNDADAWHEFWLREKDKIRVAPRPAQEPSGRTVTSKTNSSGFFGIPVTGNNVVFVLDTSGSMKATVRAKIARAGRGPTAPPKVKEIVSSRLALARKQTLRAVQGMPQGTCFSIVTFNELARQWNRKPVRIGKYSRNRAANILGRLRAKGGTNVFDALALVLEARDAGYGSSGANNIDEIFVLSDGQPTSGTLTQPDDILRTIGEINKVRRARIHTVFAGTGGGAAFMKQLAEQNGGVFVQH